MPIPGGPGAMTPAPPLVGTVPGSLITGPSQIEWAMSLVLGDRTEFFVTDLAGWDEMPAVDSGNVARAAGHGSWPGRAYAQERTVTVTFDIVPETGTEGRDTAALRAQVRSARSLSDDGTESSLVIREGNGPPLLAWGQMMRRSLPMDAGYRRRAIGCAIQWVCSDPRRFSIDEHTITSVAPVTTGVGGLNFPLTFPLQFGVGQEPADATAVNAGDAPSSPRITIYGPATRPSLTNLSTGLLLEFDLALAPGEALEIDTHQGTVTLAGGARMSHLTAISAPVEAFVLVPGPNTFALRGTFPVPGASATITWRDAQW